MHLTRAVKILLVLLLVTFVFNLASTPGVGIETRESTDFHPLLVAGFATVGLAPVAIALVLLKWPRPAAWTALVVAAVAIVLNAADVLGFASDVATPATMRAIESVIIILNAATIWAAWRVVGRSADAA